MEATFDLERPDVTHLVTEDDTPVDNFPSEKLQRILSEPLYSSWAGPGEGRSFLVAADVALYDSVHEPPVVPDVFFILDVQVADNWWEKGKRSYFFWEFGKPPEVVIEIVSNTVGGEATTKMARYARMGIAYYVIYDPLEQVQEGMLRAYELSLPKRQYVDTDPALLAGVELGLCLWQGTFEGRTDVWLRWQDAEGRLILTGAERAEQERRRAEQERQRAESAEQRAERAERQARRLLAQLRQAGIVPEENDDV